MFKVIPLSYLFLAPLPGIILGAFVAHHNDVLLSAFYPNLLAVLLGYFISALVLHSYHLLYRYWNLVYVLASVAIASSLFFPGIENVHRWIPMSSLRFNASMIFIPFIIYGVNEFIAQKSFLALALVLGTQLIHILQPDAGQAFTFGCATITIFILNRKVSPLPSLYGIIVTLAGTILAWKQPDSLEAVEHVEKILHLIIREGPKGIIALIVSLIVILGPTLGATFLGRSKIDSKAYSLTAAFFVYLLATFSVTELGNYPVPIIGAGASSILGWYFIITLLSTKMGIVPP